jgi:hypothetical protein
MINTEKQHTTGKGFKDATSEHFNWLFRLAAFH